MTRKTRRPSGREEVSEALLDAAARGFAERGLRASLRDIAAAANVNVGLIHRYFGNKSELLAATIAHRAERGNQIIRSAGDLPTAVQRVFDDVNQSGWYIKIIAWQLLEGDDLLETQVSPATIWDQLPNEANDDQRGRLLAAFLIIYGWTMFGKQLMPPLGFDEADREMLQGQLSHLLSTLVTDGDKAP